MFGVGPDDITDFTQRASPLGYLTSRYWSPSALWVVDLVVVLTGLGFVIASVNVAIRILFAMGRERVLPGSLTRLSSRDTPSVAIGCVAVLTLLIGLPLTYAHGGAPTFGYLAGAAGLSIVLIYLAVNIATIRAFRTEFRAEFRLWRHLLVPAMAAVLFLFPLWGIVHPRAHTLADLLPFAALGWLGLGAIAAGVLRARRPASFETLGRVFMPATDSQGAVAPCGRRDPPYGRGTASRCRLRGRRCRAWTCRFRGLDWLAGDEDGEDQADEGEHEQHDEGGGEWLALGQFGGDQDRADQGGAQR